MKHTIRIKRVYETRSAKDGICFLVDRVWPRGIRKESLSGVQWLRDVAPSTELRKWFGHQPVRWADFQRRYRGELEGNPESWKPLLAAVKKGDLTLLYSAKDERMNQAVVLKEFLEDRE